MHFSDRQSRTAERKTQRRRSPSSERGACHQQAISLFAVACHSALVSGACEEGHLRRRECELPTRGAGERARRDPPRRAFPRRWQPEDALSPTNKQTRALKRSRTTNRETAPAEKERQEARAALPYFYQKVVSQNRPGQNHFAQPHKDAAVTNSQSRQGLHAFSNRGLKGFSSGKAERGYRQQRRLAA